MNVSQSLVTTLPVFATSQSLGTHPRKDSPSTGRLGRWLTGTSSQRPSTANSADKSFCQRKLATPTDSVETPASPHGAEARALMTLSELALNAESNSCGTSTAEPRLVRGHVVIVTAAGQSRRVYDLTVENHHEFVAGGVLVSNCLDALRYALEGVRRIQHTKPQKVVILPTASRW
jgi:hypothetical protein